MALLAVNFGGQSIGADAAPAGLSPASQRAVDAYAARWTGLAATFGEQAQRAAAVRLQYLAGNTARSVEAYADRSAGLSGLPSRGVIAYGARWTGLAGTYAAELADAARWQGLAEAHQRRAEAQRQRAIEAYAARWEGLAQTYLQR
jgi:hypothetical protein